MNNKDEIFKKNINKNFEFDENVADVFDDMLNRSIPFYKEIVKTSAKILNNFLTDNDIIYDLGCSTATTLIEISRLIKNPNIGLIGIDNSVPMLKKAKHKVKMYSKSDRIKFICADINNFPILNAGGIILNYTLQFIRPINRIEVLKNLYNSLRDGGVIILSEKIISHDKKLNVFFKQMYYSFKKENNYSELEIANKREALEDVLIPYSIEENIKMLKHVGFKSVETFFQWFNFCSIFAIK